MLVFIDESGHPHPNDKASRPVLAAACMRQQDSREISRVVFGLKRQALSERCQYEELKAKSLVNRRTFRRVPERRELVESFFAELRNLPVTILAIIMERPKQEIPRASPFLPNQYRFLHRPGFVGDSIL